MLLRSVWLQPPCGPRDVCDEFQDFDGAESYPQGLDDVADYPKVTEELLKLHYSEADIDKILGGNFMRVLKANTGK